MKFNLNYIQIIVFSFPKCKTRTLLTGLMLFLPITFIRSHYLLQPRKSILSGVRKCSQYSQIFSIRESVSALQHEFSEECSKCEFNTTGQAKTALDVFREEVVGEFQVHKRKRLIWPPPTSVPITWPLRIDHLTYS